jgi:hypothetical protein
MQMCVGKVHSETETRKTSMSKSDVAKRGKLNLPDVNSVLGLFDFQCSGEYSTLTSVSFSDLL